MLPNKRSWEVVLLNIASGCHFRTGWSDFVRDNNLRDGDTLAFTLVSDGIFDVKRYLARSGCPPRRDIEGVIEYSNCFLIVDLATKLY